MSVSMAKKEQIQEDSEEKLRKLVADQEAEGLVDFKMLASGNKDIGTDEIAECATDMLDSHVRGNCEQVDPEDY